MRSIAIETLTDLWSPPAEWQQQDGILGLVVMSGNAEVPSPAGPTHLPACTAIFLPLQQVTSIRLEAATVVFWLVDDADRPELTVNGSIAVDEIAATVIHDVFFEHHRPEEHRALALRFVCHQLLDRSTEGTRDDSTDQLVTRVIAYMQTHLDEPITLENLEREFGCGRGQLTRRFQVEQGESPIRVLAHLRLTHARHLLQNTDLTISQIAHATGYSDLAGFSHFFKQRTGRSPSEFRDDCRWLV